MHGGWSARATARGDLRRRALFNLLLGLGVMRTGGCSGFRGGGLLMVARRVATVAWCGCLSLLGCSSRTHASVDSLRSPVEIGTGILEVKLRLLMLSSTTLILIHSLSSSIPWTDLLPCFRLLLHEVCCVDLGQTTSQLAIGDHIEASVDLLGDPLVTDLLQGHFIQTLLFSKRLLLHLYIDGVLRLESLLLVC